MNERTWTIWGVAELSCWILHRSHYWPTGHDAEDCIDAHIDCGIKHIAWDLGRSVLAYHSDIPDATCYGVGRHFDVHYPQADAQRKAELKISRDRCQLRVALTHAERTGCTIYGRLCMNRHYVSGLFRSDFAQNNPRLCEIGRDGWLDPSRLCYATPEYRAERVAILKEAIEIGCQGVVLDFLRQPPFVRYHPAFVNPYREKTGVDPRTLTLENREQFLDWCRFRAESITELLRELKAALDPIRAKEGCASAVRVRIPNDGFETNMIAGLDVKTWCEEGLVDEISLSELHWMPGTAAWDDKPYIALGREHGIQVFGSSNCLPVQRDGWSGLINPHGVNPLVLARRALQSMEDGAQGISLYQSDTGAYWPGMPEAIRAFGSEEALREYISDERIIAAYPVTDANREFGIDNHSTADDDLGREAARGPDTFRL